jgi:sugar phosphate isomerase/epimerase
MNGQSLLSRRQFLTTAAAAATLCASRESANSAEPARARFKIIAFSKPFQNLNFEETADVVAEVGWDGIECPVRARGHILPERVEDDLPKMVEALKKRNREVSMITTDIRNPSSPFAEKVLRTASKLGIKRYRLSYWKYSNAQPIAAQLETFRSELRDLAALNRDVGICGGYQNHSGTDYVGAPIWDIYGLIKDLDPKFLGVCFDIGHATLEGGLSWPIEARLMEPHFTAVYVKDFFWKKGPKGWMPEWCPLAEGMVSKTFFQKLKQSAFQGPISQHHEYETGTGSQMIRAMQRDLQVFKDWLTT